MPPIYYALYQALVSLLKLAVPEEKYAPIHAVLASYESAVEDEIRNHKSEIERLSNLLEAEKHDHEDHHELEKSHRANQEEATQRIVGLTEQNSRLKLENLWLHEELMIKNQTHYALLLKPDSQAGLLDLLQELRTLHKHNNTLYMDTPLGWFKEQCEKAKSGQPVRVVSRIGGKQPAMIWWHIA
jgi:hypothetical protein